jgi:cyclophilin family peptidyl-prolyl cis-trans isomerase
MHMYSISGRTSSATRTNQTKKPRDRRIAFESLESRRLLSSVGLSAISNVTLPAGTSIMVALNGSDPTTGKTVNFGVTTSDPTKVTPTVMPKTNQSVQFAINGLGTMTFQLFDNLTPTTTSHIETLVNAGFYNGDYIYRSQSGFVVQGGNELPTMSNGTPTGGTTSINTLPSGVPSSINEEFNPDLAYQSSGALAMARQSTPNTSGTEFFIGEGGNSVRSALDYSYTLFGFQTVDQAITVNGSATTVLKAIEAMPTESSSGFSYLTTPVKINSATLITDTQNGVLMLKAPKGATGTFTVTVTAFDDGTNTPTTRTFTVTVAADTATSAVANPWASKIPVAPTSVVFQPQPGQGTTSITSANNSSAAKELQFLVSGVSSGKLVTVYADGVAIGSATAAATSVVVITDGATRLLDGTHAITATVTAPSTSASWTDSGSSSRTGTASVVSYSSSAIQLQVVTSLAAIATIPTNVSKGGDVTVFFSGNQVEIYDNIAKAILSKAAFKSTDSVEVDCPAGQANSVLVLLPTGANAAIPQQVLVQGNSGSTNNQVTVLGTSGSNTFTLAGGTVTANGLPTTITTVQKLTLAGNGGDDTYTLTSSATPTWVVDTGGYNTMDFSHDTAGVNVNLSLDKGQAQSIAPWSTTFMLYGTINKLIGSQFADVLTGGRAATTMIRGGLGADAITGGSGGNVLLGGGGNDTITGGPGNNLIIGGAGNCSLYAKGTQNTVFAGSTNIDSNDQALLDLLGQGSHVSFGYSVRRILASAGKNTARVSSPVSFQETGAHDTIFGSNINNWFVLGKYTMVKS